MAAVDAVHEAIERGAPPAELARLARAAGPDALNASHGPLGATALQRSALCGRGGEALRALLGEGADPRAEGKGGWTALQAAAACEGPEAIAVLIEAGASRGALTMDGGETTVHLAARRRRGAVEAVVALLDGAESDEERAALLELSDDGNVTPLQAAALKGNSRVLEAVRHGGYPVQDGEWAAVLRRCPTPSCVAAAEAALRHADPALANDANPLLAGGASPGDSAERLSTIPLVEAVGRGDVACVRALLEGGAVAKPLFVKLVQNDDTVPPDEAEDRQLRIAELLLAHGASLGPATHYHYWSLYTLCFRSPPAALVDYLLRAGGGRHVDYAVQDLSRANYDPRLLPLCQWARGGHPAQLEHGAAREALKRRLPPDVANIALAYVVLE